MARRRSKLKTAVGVLAVIVAAYAIIAYIALPLVWSHYEHQRGLAGRPMVTRTAQDIPGDPINVGMVRAKNDILCAMHAAAWYPADPITFQSSMEIVGSVILDRPYRDAPVSPLYYDARREDLAFEKPVGTSADRRHHVRLWQVLKEGQEGRPVWLGDVRSRRWPESLHWAGDASYRARRRCRAGRPH